MPRLPRLHVPGGMYHVILRGNHREDLFGTARNRDVFNEIVAEALSKYKARLHAFCWMTNHIHAVVQIGDKPLSKVMQRIQMRYSRYRHKQLRTRGHLFERRYRALLVEADAYLVALLRYIHLNPVRAGMVTAVGDYPWSSHRVYLGAESLPWLTTEFGLGLFGRTRGSALRSYQVIMAQACCASEERLLEETHVDDARVLGGDRFLAALPPLRLKPKSRLTLAQLVDQVCRQQGFATSRVKSPTKDHDVSKVRAEISRRAVDERVASIGEVARYLGRSPAAVCGLLKRHGQL
jgi:putative transposase